MSTDCIEHIPARLLELDVVCMKCREVYHLTAAQKSRQSTAARNKTGEGESPRFFDPRRSRFRCPICGWFVGLAVVAYPVDDIQNAGGPFDRLEWPPPDWIPTPEQALALHKQRTGNRRTRRTRH